MNIGNIRNKILLLAAVGILAAASAAAANNGGNKNGGGNPYWQRSQSSIQVNPNGPTVVSGTIIRFIADDSRQTEGRMVIVDGKENKCGIVITSKTTIANAAKKPLSVKDIKQGKNVTVSFVKEGDQFTAISVTL